MLLHLTRIDLIIRDCVLYEFVVLLDANEFLIESVQILSQIRGIDALVLKFADLRIQPVRDVA